VSRNYELTFIVKPDLDAANTASLLEKVKELLTSEGGTIIRLDQWGMRRLMYPIRKYREGQYVFILAKLEAPTIIRIEARLRLNEDIIRYLFIRADDDLPPPVAVEEPAVEAVATEAQPVAEVTPETTTP
jgi:small subunit ribosomal protein S6